jgi:hypothetical protein
LLKIVVKQNIVAEIKYYVTFLQPSKMFQTSALC